MSIIENIDSASSTDELFTIVEIYLDSLGETENARGETWAETSDRLGGDEALSAAEKKWFDLDA